MWLVTLQISELFTDLQGSIQDVFDRPTDRSAIAAAIDRSRVVLLTGPRQIGKTTLARTFVDPSSTNYFDLEDPADLARLSEPMTALANLEGLVVIDEVQRMPELFPVIRVLVDRQPLLAKFLVLGSASPAALKQASESLTGRIEVLSLGGLRPVDVGTEFLDRLWLRGMYPSSFASRTDNDSYRWRTQYVRNLAARDLPEFGVGLPSPSVQRFLALVAHAHGQLWTNADAARSLGISESTVRKYIDVLADALIVRVLLPWHENLSKRQVKTPKVYFRDSGIAHALLGISNEAELLRHLRSGATWEGWVLECLMQACDDMVQPYFWRTSAGAELDLFIEHGGRRIGVEIKRSDAPRITPSMRAALSDLRLDKLVVVYPGTKPYSLTDQISVVPSRVLVDDPTAEFLLG